MSHKLSTLVLFFACFLGVNASLWGQNAGIVHGVRGYLDPRTGEFHPTPHIADLQSDAEPPALTTFGGKFVVNFTITVDSPIAATTKLTCMVNVTLDDVGSQNLILESAAVAIARGTGATVPCSVTIPYSWKLATASTDSVSINYEILSPVEVTAVTGTFPTRTSSQTIGIIKVPANGATTTETVTPTI